MLVRSEKLVQPENGYRFSIDPFILSAHVKANGDEKVIDIGSGCAIIPLLLAGEYPQIKITGIEIQKPLFDCAKENIWAYGLENRVDMIHQDVTIIFPEDTGGKADIIVCNPPYKKKHTGRLNPELQKAMARHEIKLDIVALLESADRLLKPDGKLYLIFPAERLSDLFSAMQLHDFTPGTFRFIHIKKNEPAKWVVLEAARTGSISSCTIDPPFYIYSDYPDFSAEYYRLYKQFNGLYERTANRTNLKRST